jgi:Zc3h12a-like Ribonuclease NYN domain
MTVKHVVVDGSNLATEGRTLPSLQQLDEAVRAYLEEYKPENVTVIVDASFPNRIDPSERAAFEGALTAAELITPPAGVIGRGDAFLLQIAERVHAVVLSNDSFQEFHGQYGWLFDQGRLIGGKPVPHVGWVFMERSPVRGPQSRRSMSEAKKTAKATTTSKAAASNTPSKRTTPKKADTQAAAPGKKAARTKATAKATKAPRRAATKPPQRVAAKHAELAVAPEVASTRRRRTAGSAVAPYNEALPFIEFVAAHPLGSEVRGDVERFSSHGAYVLVDGTRCYLPLKNLGDPAPRAAREVLSAGQSYTFVVQAFDSPRRGVDLAIPGVVVTSAPRGARAAAAGDPVQPTKEERVAPARKKKAAAKKAPARKKKAAAKKAPARKKAAAKRKAPAKRKAAKKKAPAKRKAAKKKAPAKRKAAKKKAPAKRKRAAKRAPARKATKKR